MPTWVWIPEIAVGGVLAIVTVVIKLTAVFGDDTRSDRALRLIGRKPPERLPTKKPIKRPDRPKRRRPR